MMVLQLISDGRLVSAWAARIGGPWAGAMAAVLYATSPVVLANGTTQKANTTAFGQPLNINADNFYRERQFQLGVRMRF